MTGVVVVYRGLKCDMDKPVWGLSGTDTYMDLPGVVDRRCRPGSKGSFLYGKKGKNKAEGCCSLQNACSSVPGSCRPSGSASLLLLTDKGEVGAAIGDAGAGQGR